MRFTEVGVARALRVYAALADHIGVDGAKHDLPIEEDRVYRHYKYMENRYAECRRHRCPATQPELDRLKLADESMRLALREIGDLCRDAGFGDGYVVDAVRAMAAAAKERA